MARQRSGDEAISAVAVLDDELRHGMYTFIRAARRPVTRDEAAAAVGISRKLAAFHLDKLVATGLLRAHYEAVGGIRRVGRAPKVYEPTDVDIRVSIPLRQHEMLADILMDAVLDEDDARQAAVRVAGGRGEELGAAERAQVKPGRLGTQRALTLCEAVLTRHGFEPERTAPTEVRLRNCPFHPLAARSPELICGLNHAFLAGFLRGLGARDVHAELTPRAGECCVQLRGGS